MNPGDPVTPVPSAAGTTALLLLNGTLLAGVYAFAKLGGQNDISPVAMLAWQVSFAAFVVGLVAVARGARPFRRPLHLRYAMIAGLLGVSLPNFATFAALGTLPAGVIGVIGALSPAFTYAFAVALGTERIQGGRLAGLLLGLCGVMVILNPDSRGASGGEAGWFAVAMIAPMLLAGGNLYRSLAWPAGLSPLAAAARVLVLQSVLLVPLALYLGDFRVPTWPPGPGGVALAGAGVLTAAFYIGAFELQRRAGPLIVGQLGYVITIASLAIGTVLLGERYTASALVGACLVLVGILMVQRRVTMRASASPTSGPGLTGATQRTR